MNQDEYPLITICISAYTSADTIADAIDSALKQDWPNTELLIADDCSTDNTAQVIHSKIKDHENARLIKHKENKGFAQSLNVLITEAKGEFFAIFDDDDISDPTRIRRQFERITAYEQSFNTSLIVCHTARTQHFTNGYERYEPTMGTIQCEIAPHGMNVADRILYGKLSTSVVGSCANCSRMARTIIFRDLNGYNGEMTRGEDTEFNIRLALKGGHFVGIADPLVIQTMTMGQEKKLTEERKAELSVLETNKAYLIKKGWYNFCSSWLSIRHKFLNNQKSSCLFEMVKLALRHPIKFTQKIYWTLPARKTRNDFKKWHHQNFN